jgi:hypothetical protein
MTSTTTSPAGLVRGWFRGARPAATPDAAAPLQPAPVQGAVAPPLAILAAALRAPHGASPAELSAAIIGREVHADLDPDLLDDDGFPVMAARSGEAVDAALREEIAAWLSREVQPAPQLGEAQWRALTLAAAVVDELAGAASALLVPGDAAPMLRLVPVLPEQWQAGQQRAAAMWLGHRVAQAGWPADHIALAPADESQDSLAAVLGRLARAADAPDAPLVAIAVACASHIDDQAVADWASSGSLFTAARPQGLIPGEGAAGLLVTGLRQARAMDGAVVALLDAAGEARRAASADDARRTEPNLLGELARRALEPATTLPEVAMIVADTGHRASRTLELMALAASMPQLDDALDVVRVGAALGSCGAVPFMAALALASHHARARNAPVLCISNEDPYRRCAALVRPAPA